MTETTAVDTNKLIQMVQQVLPNARIITDETQVAAFDKWKSEYQKSIPEVWTLKQFSTVVFKQPRSTKKAAAYLFKHRDELDICHPSGFIDYEHTHNGWEISSAELIEFNRAHQYHWNWR